MKKYDYNPISALNLNRAQKVIYEGKTYKSHCELSKHLGIDSRRIGEAISTGKELARVGGCVDESF